MRKEVQVREILAGELEVLLGIENSSNKSIHTTALDNKIICVLLGHPTGISEDSTDGILYIHEDRQRLYPLQRTSISFDIEEIDLIVRYVRANYF